MLGILRTIRKRHAIRRYMAVLPAQLRKDFGHRGPYTPGQVESAIVRSGRVSSAFLPYAIAIFCDAEVLKTLKLEGFEDHNLGALRSEVADRYFDGDVSFEARDLDVFSGNTAVNRPATTRGHRMGAVMAATAMVAADTTRPT